MNGEVSFKDLGIKYTQKNLVRFRKNFKISQQEGWYCICNKKYRYFECSNPNDSTTIVLGSTNDKVKKEELLLLNTSNVLHKQHAYGSRNTLH